MKPQVAGLDREKARAKLGAPHCHRGPDTWIYWFPEGCTSDRDVVTVELRGEKVVRVTSVSVATGEVCDHEF